MRSEHIEGRVLFPNMFAGSIENTVVIHADQVPCWLGIGCDNC